MKIPPLLTALYLLFWGYETGNVFIAALLAIIAECVNRSSHKKTFSVNDFVTIADTVSLILVSYITLILVAFPLKEAPYRFSEWLPIINLPILLTQYASSTGLVIIGTRIGAKKGKPHTHPPLNFAALFFVMILFSAAAGTNRGIEFFPVTAVLIFFTLLPVRNRRFSLIVFLFAFLLATATACIGHKGYRVAHSAIREAVMRWWFEHNESDWNSYHTRTSIGEIGTMKLSGTIVMHISAQKPPRYIKLASYTFYSSGTWTHNYRSYKKLSLQNRCWTVSNTQDKARQPIEISYYFPKGKGVLPHPYAPSEFCHLNISGLAKNGVGTYSVKEGPTFLNYQVLFATNNNLFPPEKADMAIASQNKDTIQTVLHRIEMPNNATAKEKIDAIVSFFKTRFSYSLTLSGSGSERTPLRNFLLKQHKGHCELFATATVLMLRNAGIPARYVIGYVVEEKASYSNDYIVRERHAHAWAEAWYNGSWHIVDSTPNVWFERDQQHASFFESIEDLWEFLQFSYKQYRVQKHPRSALYMSIAVIVLSIILIIRIIRRIRKNRTVSKQKRLERLAAKSPFYRAAQHISALTTPMEEHETTEEFVMRVAHIFSAEPPDDRLIFLHRKLLFSPKGLTEQEIAELEKKSKQYINTFLRHLSDRKQT